MLKLPVTPLTEWLIWIFVDVEEIVSKAPTKGVTVPFWNPITTIEAAEVAEFLFMATVMQGNPDKTPLTQIKKDPKVGKFIIDSGVFVTAIG
jgi:hypothetical protein